jgi:predicted Co/Zn/Cd cation transporter (cation efflux family)
VPDRPLPDLDGPGVDGPDAEGPATGPVAVRPDPAAAGERAALIGSIVASSVSGVLAVVWGVLSGARIILFDGAYALIGIGIAALSLRIAHAVAAGPTRRFPFGRDGLTPLMVVGQGVALAATLFYAGTDAVTVISEGGTAVAPGNVAAYGAVTGLISLAAAWWLRRKAPGSDLVDAEAQQWRADAILSVVMVVGALVGLGLVGAGRADLADYVDPVLVLVACAVLVPTPLRLLRSGTVELLEGVPPVEITDAVHAVVEDVRQRFALDEPIVRLHKLGRKLYVEVDFVVEPGEWDVSEEDAVRRAVAEGLVPLGLDVWAYVELTTDRALVE